MPLTTVNKSATNQTPANGAEDLIPALVASGGNSRGPFWVSLVAEVAVDQQAAGTLVCEVQHTDANGGAAASTVALSLSDASQASGAIGPFCVLRNSLESDFKVTFTLFSSEVGNATFSYSFDLVRFK